MRYQIAELSLESSRRDDELLIRWLGRSEVRDPGRMLQLLLDAVGSDLRSARSIEFDFRALEYMNSSSILPLLKLVQTASSSAANVRVRYDAGKNWQRMSFPAIGAALAILGNVQVTV
jgi:hypothetical protein